MSQVINTNIPSLNTQRYLSGTGREMSIAVQRLSSGLRVNSAKDDAAGLAIAERMNSQVRGMNVAIRNSNDGISMAQVAEGALGKVGEMLQRMRELAVQSANATNGDSDRANLDAEYQQLAEEITRTITGARFNGADVLADGSGDKVFQIGAGTTAEDTFTIAAGDLSTRPELTIVIGGNILDVPASRDQMDNIDTLLTEINTERATWGAAQNRFEAIISNLQISAENQTAARSRIMDADYAAETAALTRAQVLQQAGTAMLAQANQLPQSILQLLG
ncbi:MAG: flagellin [Burkholderiaceae bacterium]